MWKKELKPKCALTNAVALHTIPLIWHALLAIAIKTHKIRGGIQKILPSRGSRLAKVLNYISFFIIVFFGMSKLDKKYSNFQTLSKTKDEFCASERIRRQSPL